MNQIPPLYSDETVAEWLAKLPTLRDVLVDDVNHYTIGLSERGAKALADVVREEASA
jgi:lipase